MNFPALPLDNEQIEEAHSSLVDKNPNYEKCYSCGKDDVSILPYLSRKNFGAYEEDDIAISVLSTVCNNCGIVSNYSLRTLGLEFDAPWTPEDLDSNLPDGHAQ